MKSFLSNKRREAKSEKRRQQINERSSPSKEGKLFRPTDSLLQLQLLPFVRMKIAQLFLIPSEKRERERASEELNFVPIPTDFWMWSLAEMHIVELRMKRQSDKSKATTILSSSLLYAASSLAGFFRCTSLSTIYVIQIISARFSSQVAQSRLYWFVFFYVSLLALWREWRVNFQVEFKFPPTLTTLLCRVMLCAHTALYAQYPEEWGLRQQIYMIIKSLST